MNSLLLFISLILFVPFSLTDERAPEKFSCIMEITRTQAKETVNVTLDITRAWAPLGVDRFYTLVKQEKYYDNSGFFRVLPGFVVQFGIAGDPALSKKWENANIQDDPVLKSNTRGYISYATAGPNTRTTQLFINYGNNARLDNMGFAPFGVVSASADMIALDHVYSGYGQDPDQGEIYAEGNTYLKKNYPNLDYIKSITIV